MNRLCRNAVAGVFVLLMGWGIAGCSRGAGWLDDMDRSDPLLQRAAARLAEGEIDAAVRLYVQALDENPRAARGHLDLALLLHDSPQDYARAIYHYNRYLELRPDTDKRGMIEDRIRLAEQLFAAKVLPPNVRSGVVSAELQKENEELRQTVRILRDEVRTLKRPSTSQASGQKTGGRSRKSEKPDSGGLRTYRVKSGDTLSSIASELYSDAKRWKEIQKANEEILGRSSRLKVGQILIIP